MSDVSVDIIKNRSGEAPDLPSGANLSGVSTAATLQVTNLNPTHINASGVTTATTFSGSMKSTSTPTLGLGVTINSSGVNISGVATAGIVSATTLYGDGSNLTGVAMSIAPISYQPSVSGGDQGFTVGIGITFTERIKAGSGNVTLRLVSAGGTVVENFGVGSSVTISENRVSFTPTAGLTTGTVYHLSYPSGCFTNNEGSDYVGTAYTFATKTFIRELYVAGNNDPGGLGQNNRTYYSSPVQIPGTTWTSSSSGSYQNSAAVKTDNTLWVWGRNQHGQLAQNEQQSGGPGGYLSRSSPTQVPGTTWSKASSGAGHMLALKTDGTIWSWGYNVQGQLGNNTNAQRSSPVQIPGTTWSAVSGTYQGILATKTDGTMWGWGYNYRGTLGLNSLARISSPVQIPGTTWSTVGGTDQTVGAIKTDGTLWMWGLGGSGQLGDSANTTRSSPVQIPGTTWAGMGVGRETNYVVKTDGTLWTWGANDEGQLGLNNTTKYSSPVQIPGTDWSSIKAESRGGLMALKQF